MSRFRIPSWNQPQSFSIYMWQGHDILAKHPIICGRIGMPKPCKSNKGLRTKATSSLFTCPVVSLGYQNKSNYQMHCDQVAVLRSRLPCFTILTIHAVFVGSKLRVCKSNYLGMNFISLMHESMCFPNALTENKAKQHYIFYFPTAARIHCCK